MIGIFLTVNRNGDMIQSVRWTDKIDPPEVAEREQGGGPYLSPYRAAFCIVPRTGLTMVGPHQRSATGRNKRGLA